MSVFCPEPNSPQKPDQDLTVSGSILVVIERTDDEFTKLLRNLDPHGTEYVERLADETKLCVLLGRVRAELEKRNASADEMCRIYLREVEHLYYKVSSATSQLLISPVLFPPCQRSLLITNPITKVTQSYPKLPKVTQSYPKLPKVTQSYPKLPKVTPSSGGLQQGGYRGSRQLHAAH